MHGSPLVTGADQFEQHAGFGLVLGDVGHIVENAQVEAVDRGFEPELAPGDLQLLRFKLQILMKCKKNDISYESCLCDSDFYEW